MSPENRKRIQEAVSEAGDYLKDKLTSLIGHPERNAYAHLWKGIKTEMNVDSYKDCNDSDVDVILSIVAKMRANPN